MCIRDSLMTVKARKLLEQSGAVLFAGSLVDQAATLYAPDAVSYTHLTLPTSDLV